MRRQTKLDVRPARPSYRFFGGKGGVGKTTCAAAHALACAERGERVLIVSTDPAHSLGDALDAALPRAGRELRVGKGSVIAVELDAAAAMRRWLARRKRTLATIAERGTYLNRGDVDRLLDLTMPGVDELVGLIEIERLAAQRPYSRLVIDAAPTGHLLRLLEMPDTLAQIATLFDRMQEKHRFLSLSLAHSYRPDRSDALIEDLQRTARELRLLLEDPERCRFSWVMLPEAMSLAETADGLRALAAARISLDRIIVNRMPGDRAGCRCASCVERRAAAEKVLASIRTKLRPASLTVLEEQASEPVGVRALLAVGRALDRPRPTGARPGPARTGRPKRRPASARVAASGTPWLEILAPGGRRLLLIGGKGGVGKTTCATTMALCLARSAPARRVLLLSTDPAHSLGDCLGVTLGDAPAPVRGAPSNLRVRELDASLAYADQRERHRIAVDRLFRHATDRSGVELSFDREIVRDLFAIVPPGVDELVGMLAITEALLPGRRGGRPEYDVVVVDTAPTGHALRLLEMPEVALQWVHALIGILLEYRRAFGLGELAASLVELSARIKELAALLRDPARTGFVAVLRDERLVALETARLLARLRRLGIPLRALIRNAAPAADCRSGRGRATAGGERHASVPFAGAEKCAMIVAPAAAPPPRGPRALLAWGNTWRVEDA
jgi:arsenite-transporting ATPase